MFEDLAILRPTVLSSTPRLFNAIHNEYKKALAAALSRLRQRKLASLQPTGEPEAMGKEESKEEEAGKDGEGGEEEEEEEGVYARYLTPVEDEGDTEAEVERLVLRQFSKLLGGRVAVLVTGGAPTSPSVLQFLDKYATRHDQRHDQRHETRQWHARMVGLPDGWWQVLSVYGLQRVRHHRDCRHHDRGKRDRFRGHVVSLAFHPPIQPLLP
jgi:hypothetical protein